MSCFLYLRQAVISLKTSFTISFSSKWRFSVPMIW